MTRAKAKALWFTQEARQFRIACERRIFDYKIVVRPGSVLTFDIDWDRDGRPMRVYATRRSLDATRTL